MITTNPYKTIIRFDQAAEQADGALKRVVGFVQAKNMLSLFDDATLDANPRSARANAVTTDIIESVAEAPQIFQFKTKGILLGSSDYSELDRRRYELRFNNPAYEGLLDGGHNMLALGTYLLSKVMDPKDVKKLKLWEDMKAAWEVNREAVLAIKDQFIGKKAQLAAHAVAKRLNVQSAKDKKDERINRLNDTAKDLAKWIIQQAKELVFTINM